MPKMLTMKNTNNMVKRSSSNGIDNYGDIFHIILMMTTHYGDTWDDLMTT